MDKRIIDWNVNVCNALGVFLILTSIFIGEVEVAAQTEGKEQSQAQPNFDAAIIKRIDIRRPESKSKAFVAFCSRQSPNESKLPGHAFVAVGAHDGEKPVVSKAYGMYKKEDNSENIGEIPRSLSEESVSSLDVATCRLMVDVDEVELLKLADLTQAWEKKDYVPTISDCVSYTEAVAKKLDLLVPERSGTLLFPVPFIRELTTVNTTPDQLKKYEEKRKQAKAKHDEEKKKREDAATIEAIKQEAIRKNIEMAQKATEHARQALEAAKAAKEAQDAAQRTRETQEAIRKAEEARRAAEQAKKQQEEAARRAEEARKAAEQAKKQQEEAARRAEEARKAAQRPIPAPVRP